MEQDKTITPDAIVIFSGGIIPSERDGGTHWRSTTYEENDAFGTLGGRDRIEAAALLAKKYPSAHLVTTSHRLGRITPSLAQVYADELSALGIEKKRIAREEQSSTTQTAITAALQLAREKNWRHLIFVSSEYHLPRIRAFYEGEKSNIAATTVSSESVLMHHDPAFAEYFEKVKKSPEYQKRLVAEQRGLEAIKRGAYHSAPTEDKRER